MAIESPDLLEQSRLLAQQYYVGLPYHNWEGHVISMLAYEQREIPKIKLLGVSINDELVSDATYWHDANFHLKPQEYGFDTKEDHSADLAVKNLAIIGRGDIYIDGVKKLIEVTKPGALRDDKTNELVNEKTLIVESDIHNLSKPGSVCIKNALDLADEALKLGNNLAVSAEIYFKSSANFLLEQYLASPLRYITDDGHIIERGMSNRKLLRGAIKIGEATVEKISNDPRLAPLVIDKWQKT